MLSPARKTPFAVSHQSAEEDWLRRVRRIPSQLPAPGRRLRSSPGRQGNAQCATEDGVDAHGRTELRAVRVESVRRTEARSIGPEVRVKPGPAIVGFHPQVVFGAVDAVGPVDHQPAHERVSDKPGPQGAFAEGLDATCGACAQIEREGVVGHGAVFSGWAGFFRRAFMVSRKRTQASRLLAQ